MSIDESLVAYLLTKSAITTLVGSRVVMAKAPQGDALPYLWVNRGTSEDEDDLAANSGSTTQFRETFDVEAVSDDLDEAQTLAQQVKSLHKTRGDFGSGSVQGLFVSDHTDNYQPTNISADDGRHVATAEIEVVGYEE